MDTIHRIALTNCQVCNLSLKRKLIEDKNKIFDCHSLDFRVK